MICNIGCMFWTFRHWFNCFGGWDLVLVFPWLTHRTVNKVLINCIIVTNLPYLGACSGFFWVFFFCLASLYAPLNWFHMCAGSHWQSPGDHAGQREGLNSPTSSVGRHVSTRFFSGLKAFFVIRDHKYQSKAAQSVHSLLQSAVSHFVSSLKHADPELCTHLVLLCLGNCCSQPGWRRHCWSRKE